MKIIHKLKALITKIAKLAKLAEKTMKKDEIRIDENGREYVKRPVYKKYINLSSDDAYFRCSDEDAERTFFITLIFGIIGIHHLLRGDYPMFFLYILTGGGFGVLYVSDVLSIILGHYSYFETVYTEDEYEELIRRKEKVYLKPIENKKLLILGIFSIPIAVFTVVFLIMPAYSNINRLINELAISNMTEYVV